MNFKKALFWTVTVSCILAGTGFALNLPSRLLANENDSDDRRITIDPDAGPRILNTLLETLPDGEPTCCEREWIIRMLHYHPAAVVPQMCSAEGAACAGKDVPSAALIWAWP